MEATQIRDGEVTTVELKGAIDINSTRALKEILLQALEAGKDISVSPEGITTLDVSAAQLLWAMRRDAEGRGLQFHFTGAIRQEVLATISEAGIDLLSRSNEAL